MNRNVGQWNRKKFSKAHADTMFVQPLFGELGHDEIRKNTFAYGPCWGILDPGMTMEKHRHAIPEFYVFTEGDGVMTLGKKTFPVRKGMAVNIPPNDDHEVSNAAESIGPLIWVSIGLKEGA